MIHTCVALVLACAGEGGGRATVAASNVRGGLVVAAAVRSARSAAPGREKETGEFQPGLGHRLGLFASA